MNIKGRTLEEVLKEKEEQLKKHDDNIAVYNNRISQLKLNIENMLELFTQETKDNIILLFDKTHTLHKNSYNIESEICCIHIMPFIKKSYEELQAELDNCWQEYQSEMSKLDNQLSQLGTENSGKLKSLFEELYMLEDKIKTELFHKELKEQQFKDVIRRMKRKTI